MWKCHVSMDQPWPMISGRDPAFSNSLASMPIWFKFHTGNQSGQNSSKQWQCITQKSCLLKDHQSRWVTKEHHVGLMTAIGGLLQLPMTYGKWSRNRVGYAVATTTIRLQFDGRSTTYQRSLRSHTRWRNPLAAVTLTYLFTQATVQHPGCNIGRWTVIAHSN